MLSCERTTVHSPEKSTWAPRRTRAHQRPPAPRSPWSVRCRLSRAPSRGRAQRGEAVAPPVRQTLRKAKYDSVAAEGIRPRAATVSSNVRLWRAADRALTTGSISALGELARWSATGRCCGGGRAAPPAA